MLTGIDVSEYQGAPDFNRVKAAGYVFGIARATTGYGKDAKYLDPTFARNWHAMKEAGLLRGAYHYAYPLNSTGAAQAEWFVSQVTRQGYGAGDLPLVLDLEDENAKEAWAKTPGKMSDWVADFVTKVENMTGRKPIIYTGAYYYSGPSYGCKLWLPSYFDNPRAPWDGTVPKLPPAWKNYTIWQHTSKGRVSGVVGVVDMNVFPGDINALKKLAGLPGRPSVTLADRLKKAGLGAKSVATILKKLGRKS